MRQPVKGAQRPAPQGLTGCIAALACRQVGEIGKTGVDGPVDGGVDRQFTPTPLAEGTFGVLRPPTKTTHPSNCENHG